jgi:N6-adenosine-specific RNA methylase IME4
MRQVSRTTEGSQVVLPTISSDGERAVGAAGPDLLTIRVVFPVGTLTVWCVMRKYGMMYMDPPWTFKTYSAKGTGRSAISHYDCMTFDELKAMPVEDWALPDCVLMLWVPGPHTLQGLQLMNAWGFTFKGTAFVWIKCNKSGEGYPIGCGYGTRKNAEFCWQGTRGHPQRLSASVRELVVEPRRAHSQKPDRIRDDIRRLYPGPYLELFARSTAPGWDHHGDQAGLFDRGPVKTRRQPSCLVRRPLAA